MNRLENLLELEKHLVEIKKLSTIADIDFADHYEAMYNQWRLEYGRERGEKKASKLNLTEEEKEKLRKLEVLDLKLSSLAVALNRENAIDILSEINIDLECCIRKTRGLMRTLVTSREQYVEVSE